MSHTDALRPFSIDINSAFQGFNDVAVVLNLFLSFLALIIPLCQQFQQYLKKKKSIIRCLSFFLLLFFSDFLNN